MLGQGIIGKGGAVYGLLPDGQDAQQILRDTSEKCSLPSTFLFWSPCLIHSKFTNTKHSGKSIVPEAAQHPHTISHAIVTPMNPPYPCVSNGAQGVLQQMGRRKLTLCPDGNFGNGVGGVAGTGWTSAEQLFPSQCP